MLFSGNADHQLKKGLIWTQGSFRADEAESVFATTGGTGKYRRARGMLTLKSVPSKPEEFTYRVLWAVDHQMSATRPLNPSPGI